MVAPLAAAGAETAPLSSSSKSWTFEKRLRPHVGLSMKETSAADKEKSKINQSHTGVELNKSEMKLLFSRRNILIIDRQFLPWSLYNPQTGSK